VKQKEQEALLRKKLTIVGDGNVVGTDNTVSIVKLASGDYYAIQIGELHITLSSEELHQILAPVRSTSRLMWISLIASAVIILGVAIILCFQYRQNQKPRQMTGEFNVAVAEIVVVDPDGRTVRSGDGKAVAEFLAQRLETYFEGIDERSIRYEIWPPDNTGRITGKNPEERARAAESLAQRINAHIVVYGVVAYRGDHSQFTPEFFVNYKGFELAQEAIGPHQFGSSMIVPLPFDMTKLQAVENPALAARVKALSLMTIGLAYYSIDDFEEALDYFGQAIETEGWSDTAGKEVLYLLQGNTYIRLASNERATRYVQLAENSYSKALSVNPAYIRAKLGLSGVIYLKSVGDPNEPSFETVDLDGLVEAEQILLDILAIKDLPESMNYRAKINFSLGRIYLVRAQVLGGDWLEQAQVKSMEVIQEYEMGNQQIVNLAGHAHAQAGLIELLKGNNDEAINHYIAAVELVTPYYQAHYSSILGEIYNATGRIELAIDTYKQAIQIAEFYGDEEGIYKYSQRLSEIQNEEGK
jgi:tetratricopeptide (TPR) repeat protein